MGSCWQEVGAAEAGNIESGPLEGRKQGLFGVAEEEQDVTEVAEAVDVLFVGSKGVACWTVPMFYLAVVLERGDVVGGGLRCAGRQLGVDEAEVVMHDVMAALERSLAQEMPLTGAMTAEEKRPRPAADRYQGALGLRSPLTRTVVHPLDGIAERLVAGDGHQLLQDL